MCTGAPVANYLTAKRVGNMLYVSGLIAVDPTVRKVVTSYDDLPNEARKQLHTRGYNARQISVDIFETLASVQSWFVLNRI